MLYSQRLSQFMAQISLKKYQRTLIQSFDKYQQEQEKFPDDQDWLNLFDQFDIEELEDPRKELVKNVIDNFDPESNEVDRYILYEITQFREGDSDSEFWRSYEDYLPEYK